MDARRLGVGPYLPQTFLTDAAIDYMEDADYDALPDQWELAAFAELARTVHGKQAPVRRVRARPGQTLLAGEPVYRLADYLEQHGRTQRQWQCPPAQFWQAAARHIPSVDDLMALADAARRRCRFQQAMFLYGRAVVAARSLSPLRSVGMMAIECGDLPSAAQWFRLVADTGDVEALVQLADLVGEEESELLLRQAADADHSGALIRLARACEEQGGIVEAGLLYRRAANAGDTQALRILARRSTQAGDWARAEQLYREAIAAGDTLAVLSLASVREELGDDVGAEQLLRDAAEAGENEALISLAWKRCEANDWAAAEHLLQQAAARGYPEPWLPKAEMLEAAGHLARAEAVYREACATGDVEAMLRRCQLVVGAAG